MDFTAQLWLTVQTLFIPSHREPFPINHIHALPIEFYKLCKLKWVHQHADLFTMRDCTIITNGILEEQYENHLGEFQKC